MGDLFKSKSSSVTDPTAKAAFNEYLPALAYGADKGIDLANEVFGTTAYGGQRVAGLNGFQAASADRLGDFGNAFTNPASWASANLGYNNVSPGQYFGQNAASIFQNFGPTADPTQSIINNAGQYANNPYVDGLIDSSSRDVTRNLFENQLPGVGLRAAGSGNTNSTRAGVESAILQRGAADRLADMSSQIRSQFFGKGLDMSQNQYNQNLNNALAANQGLLQAGQFGLQGLDAAQNIAGRGFQQNQAAGGVFQNQAQRELDANKSVFDEGLANRLAVLANLQGVVGTGTGARSSAGVNTTPSPVSQVASLVGAFT